MKSCKNQTKRIHLSMGEFFVEITSYLKEQFATNEFFSGAVVVTFLGSALYQMKEVPLTIWKRIKRRVTYSVTVYEQSELFTAIEAYFEAHHPKGYRNAEAYYEGERDNEKVDKEDALKVKIAHLEDTFIFFWRRWPVYFSKSREKLEQARGIHDAYLVSYRFGSVLGRYFVNDFLKVVTDNFNNLRREKITIDVYVNVNSFELWSKTREINRSLDSVIIDSDVRSLIVSDLASFESNRDKFLRLDIPYKRGYLFYGPPGNGKSSLVCAIADYTKKNIYYINLKSVSSDEVLQSLFLDIPDNCILLLEDVDATFNGRDPLGKITFSGLLNCLDGVFYKEGLITIMTTNHLEKLDPALTRSGRVDVKIRLGNPTKALVESYLSLFYGETISLPYYEQGPSMSDILGVCLACERSKEAVDKIAGSHILTA